MKFRWTIVSACFLLIAAMQLYVSTRASASDPATKSQFLTSYDPRPLIKEFGWECSSDSGVTSSSSAWSEVKHVRDSSFNLRMDRARIAILKAALLDHAEKQLRAIGARVRGPRENAGKHIFEYDIGNSSGQLLLEPIDPDWPGHCGDETSVKICFRIDEKWHR